jgi:hypothetical protein
VRFDANAPRRYRVKDEGTLELVRSRRVPNFPGRDAEQQIRALCAAGHGEEVRPDSGFEGLSRLLRPTSPTKDVKRR